MSLEELKRQNAEEEARIQEEPQLEESAESEAAEELETEVVETEGSEEAADVESEPVEAWMQSDDQASQDNGTVPVANHIKMRQKLKGSLKEKNSEIEDLKAEIESLKSARTAAPVAAKSRPKRDDFLDADDPDEAYFEALTDWKLQDQTESRKAEEAKRQQQLAQEDLNKQVESHYQRAAKLLDNHKLSADVYQSADSGFRQAVDAASPGHGDAITDMIISQIGEGSEKLIMYVGNSQARKEQLQTALATDPNGLKAMRLIGKWESEMSAPTKRISQAPKPAKQAVGDANTTVSIDKYRKRYEKAHATNNTQEAFNIKREARSKNIDVSNW